MIYEIHFNLEKTILAIFVVLAILFFPYPSNAEEKNEVCLESEPTIVKIIGTFYRKTFPGPPEYESIEKGDRPETYWILKLDYPICVNRALQEEFWEKRVIRNVQNITLVLSSSMYKKYENLMGKKVLVSGALYDAHTGHHRTPILITVKNIYPEETVSGP